MDASIALVTPAMHRQRGADAFDRGEDIDEHGMNPWVSAIEDWQKGWRERQRQYQEDLAWSVRERLRGAVDTLEKKGAAD